MAIFTYSAPVVGGSENTWGATLNTNWSNLSTFLGSLDSAELAVLDGITADTAELNLLDGVTATTAEINLLDGVTATTAELNYTDGVTSAIQTQLDAKAADTTQAETDWEAGASTTESIVSPAKVKASVIANTVNYTQPTTAGAVGTYAMLVRATSSSTIEEGSTYAGSDLRFSGFRVGFNAFYEAYSPGGVGGTPSGTWRAMGRTNTNSGINPVNIFVRIS
tara:strand:- start:691 stop:1356 length:666 start_codon:yes stop_codon:yes gene_type:complete